MRGLSPWYTSSLPPASPTPALLPIPFRSTTIHNITSTATGLMNYRSPSPVRDFTPPKGDDEELHPIMQSQEQHFDRDSSSDDVPLRQQRAVRALAGSTHPHESSHDLYDRRHHDYAEPHLLDQRRPAYQATPRKPAKVGKSTGKTPKKPGPRPWTSKSIKKNVMVAKMEVIREIERCWGKGFIRAFILKFHRPLVKRGKGGKRVTHRDYETGPKRWLPSVLKAILSIARLTVGG